MINLSHYLAAKATAAVTSEILTAPKPGLVDPASSGAHADMNWILFIKSSAALSAYWQRQAAVGLSGVAPDEAIIILRKNGLEMERAMLEATGGVNTHKGLIYAMSLWLYGSAKCIASDGKFCPQCAANFARTPVENIAKKELLSLKNADKSYNFTHGERLYLEYGIEGIRGEAARGFPSVVNAGCKAYQYALKSGAHPNFAALSALLAIMEVCEDTNIIHRAGFDFWAGTYKNAVADTIGVFNPASGDASPLIKLNELLIKHNASPGGAADLLACTIFACGLE